MAEAPQLEIKPEAKSVPPDSTSSNSNSPPATMITSSTTDYTTTSGTKRDVSSPTQLQSILNHQSPQSQSHPSSTSSSSSVTVVPNQSASSGPVTPVNLSPSQQTFSTMDTPPGGTGVPPRKRSKVSRACDECRRKKIRCDAALSNSNSQVTKVCTNCGKTGDICTFTRVPLKRGPTKGYSKGSDDGNNSIGMGISSNGKDQLQQQMQPQSQIGSQNINGFHQLLPIGSQQQHPLPPSHAFPNAFQGGQPGQSKQVILPPLNSLQQSQLGSQPQQLLSSSVGATAGQHVLPPIQGRQRSTSLNSLTSQQQGQGQQQQQGGQPIFWKVPYEMPQFDGRRGSIDSISSSISGSFSPSNRPSSITGLVNSPRSRTASGVDSMGTSDSEDEFLNNNASKLSRNSFQIPITSRSPQASYTKESGLSPVPSQSSLSSLNQGMARVSLPSIQQQQPLSQQYAALLKSIEFNIDLYFSKLHNQYPILPKRQLVLECFERLSFEQFTSIFELFNTSLQIINSIDLNFDFNLIISSFQQINLLYASKSFIYNDEYAKVIFLTCLVLLNYSVLLSGHNYSIGLSISFSIFHDWKVFNSDWKSINFKHMMNMLIFDNLYSLKFGLPRNSNVDMFVNGKFIEEYLKVVEVQEYETLEYFCIGLQMLQLSGTTDHLLQTHEIKKLDVSETLYNRVKFLNILKCENDIYFFFQALKSNLSSSATNVIDPRDSDSFLFESQLEFYKLVKKTINLIDEQLDDLESMKLCPVIPIILTKCFKLLQRLETLTNSLIRLNSTVLLNNEFKPRLSKLIESIQSNASRLLVMRIPLPFLRALLTNLASVQNKDSDKNTIVLSAAAGAGDNKLEALKNWCGSSSDFLGSDIRKEFIKGWYS